MTSMYFIKNMPRSHILRLDCSEGQFISVSIDEMLLAAVIIVKKNVLRGVKRFQYCQYLSLCVETKQPWRIQQSDALRMGMSVP